MAFRRDLCKGTKDTFWYGDRDLALKEYFSVMTRPTFLLVAVIFVFGCVHVISKDVIEKVNSEITFAALKKDPQAYREKIVLLGGVIVKAVNKKDGTLLEVYQTKIDPRGRPIQLDMSEGRFLALYKGFLDSEIYQKGRKVTIVGVVQGEEMIRIGEIDYHCPSLVIKEMYLWEKEQPLKYEPYPWGPWYPWWYPWQPWHPYHSEYRK